MDEINVNRLNGIPNFGHGFPEAEATEQTAETVDVVEPAPEETKEVDEVELSEPYNE